MKVASHFQDEAMASQAAAAIEAMAQATLGTAMPPTAELLDEASGVEGTSHLYAAAVIDGEGSAAYDQQQPDGGDGLGQALYGASPEDGDDGVDEQWLSTVEEELS